MLLVEKYRPNTLGEVLGNEEVVGILSKKGGDFPHLLFAGPPGTGKTSIAHILMKGFDALELNASDDRGIDVVRSKIKGFCMKKAEKKLVILDECDSLTTSAQQALRRLMETTDTKFILICNQLSKLIEPIQSRCALLRFSKVPERALKAKIQEICKAEEIKLTESGFTALFFLSNGDIRACLNMLQGLLYLHKPVDGDLLFKISGVPSRGRIEDIFKLMKEKRVDECIRHFEKIWDEKYEPSDLISGFMSVAKSLESYEAMKVVGKYHLRVTEGVSSKLQFYGMIGELLDISW